MVPRQLGTEIISAQADLEGTGDPHHTDVASDTLTERLIGCVQIAVQQRGGCGPQHRVPGREAGRADTTAICCAEVIMKCPADVEAVVSVVPAAATQQPAGIADRRREAGLRRAIRPWRWTILVYLASRILLLGVAIVAAAINHISLATEVGRWDGTWYAQIASAGYPMHVAHIPTTLGFFPLYPYLMGVVGDPMVYVSGGAEHQGPSGGGPVAVIARRA